ncbi:hypothetical protein [Nisaea sp.]|uniref:hypothetical protein n=1 Tax=Nisaea sp. TaxID=2024842 RepID=UPI0032987393
MLYRVSLFKRRAAFLPVLLTLLLFIPVVAHAHGASGGLILLLPRNFYTVGATLAVAASFVLLAVVPQKPFHRLATTTLSLFRLSERGGRFLSIASTVLVFVLLAAGLYGSYDPLRNPLPLVLWTVGWISMTLACAVFGNLWAVLNPWTGLVDLAHRYFRPRMTLPVSFGYLLAVLQFLIFIWVDLISPYSMDSSRLFFNLSAFWYFNLVGMLLFGKEDWCERAEPLHVYFRLVSAIAPLGKGKAGDVRLGFPGAHAVSLPSLSQSGVAFVLLSLAAGTFDGWSTTFRWIGMLGFNPLNFPGRYGVMWQNSLGLLASWALIWGLYHVCVRVGARLAGAKDAEGDLTGRLVYSILPISVAYHGSHFLTRLLVDYQYLYQMISDPFSLGWDLFGTAQYHVTTSFFSRPDTVFVLWNIQTAIITIGHVVGICMAHTIALDRLGSGRKAVLSQILLALFMVGYTAMGLWLLGAPRI